jgi:hypothetical protein
VFFDATGTSDTATLGGANNTFQDVYYSWSFGDTGASGSGTWGYGANAGKNSKNTATGAVAAHLYITNGSDTTYPVTVTAYDGTETASCQLGVTAYDAAGANGYPGSATTCVAANSLPVAGSGGCPAGAGVLRQSNMGTALSSALGAQKRVLFHCGDTFSGSYYVPAGVAVASIGAYGGCENTTTSRPIFQNSSGGTLNINNGGGDVRVADIDFEDGTQSVRCVNLSNGIPQVTLYNLMCNKAQAAYYTGDNTQFGLIQSVMTTQNNTEGTFLNISESHCINGSTTIYCGFGSYSQSNYLNASYTAVLGNNLNGAGQGFETLRISLCRMCVISNNTLQGAAGGTANLKLHEGHPGFANNQWDGQYTEFIEISDNLFTGPSGAYEVETAPQSGLIDERLRYIIIERNLWTINTRAGVGLYSSAVNLTARNNVIYTTANDGPTLQAGLWMGRRGIEPPSTADEVYNNTCYALAVAAYTACIQLTSDNSNSFAQNNLFYGVGGNSLSAINNSGKGNTVSNNTSNSTVTFSPINASGSFSVISDFWPTQNYSGGVAVPVWYDALGTEWSPTWSLGALKP